MPFPKIAEFRELSDEQIATEIVKVKQELFDLRILKACLLYTSPSPRD